MEVIIQKNISARVCPPSKSFALAERIARERNCFAVVLHKKNFQYIAPMSDPVRASLLLGWCARRKTATRSHFIQKNISAHKCADIFLYSCENSVLLFSSLVRPVRITFLLNESLGKETASQLFFIKKYTHEHFRAYTFYSNETYVSFLSLACPPSRT